MAQPGEVFWIRICFCLSSWQKQNKDKSPTSVNYTPPHTHKHQKKFPNYQKLYCQIFLPGTVSFIIVRDPFERLLSSFKVVIKDFNYWPLSPSLSPQQDGSSAHKKLGHDEHYHVYHYPDYYPYHYPYRLYHCLKDKMARVHTPNMVTWESFGQEQRLIRKHYRWDFLEIFKTDVNI